MKQCKKCGDSIPYSVVIDGVKRILQNRVHCVNCVPFGKSRYVTKTEEGRRRRVAQKSRAYYCRYKEENGIDRIRERRKKYKMFLVELLGGGCQICTYDRCTRSLTFHHLHDKEFGITERAFQFSLEVMLTEVRKCVLMCHNCHGELHEGVIEPDLDVINQKNIEILGQLSGKTWTEAIG